MRFMLTARTKFMAPPEMVPGLIEAFVAWWDRYQDRWESAGFFAGQDGGGGICSVADEAEFNRMMLEWPLAPFSECEVHALLDVDVALGQWREVMGSMGGA